MKSSKYRFFVLLIILSFCISGNSQHIDLYPDLLTIKQKLSEKQKDPYKRPYIYKGDSSIIKKINPVNALAGGAFYIYQNVISRHLSASCIYNPSCSDFGKEAVRDFGLMKGTLLSIDRLNRCNRLSAIYLKNQSPTAGKSRYPDPVSRYQRLNKQNGK